MTGALTAINLVALLLEGVAGDTPFTLFALWPLQADFMPWQLLSHAFLHGNGAHLLLNMLGLWVFGGLYTDMPGEQ